LWNGSVFDRELMNRRVPFVPRRTGILANPIWSILRMLISPLPGGVQTATAEVSSFDHTSPHRSPYWSGMLMNQFPQRRRLASSGATICRSGSSKNAFSQGGGRTLGVAHIEAVKVDRHRDLLD
jgi:hypothetical protein